ncbi:hypothetical protein HPULCUR_005599 [Helicostylum pulchrum]|uniref:Uncharacterized protein n=1 Tax=Helicostylum pulchrum TaxID=562976 RepID=A0ABP9XZJ1_9FUNG
MKSSSVSVIADDIEDRIAEFIRTNLFYVATDDGRVRNPLKRFLKGKLVPFDEDRIIEVIMEQIYSHSLPPLDEEKMEKGTETKPWIIFQKRWMLTENQKHFIMSLSPLSVCAGISSFLFSDLKEGAGIGIFEAVRHSVMYGKPLIMQSEDLSTSSSVFLNSKPDVIVNLDISLGSTLLTYSLLNKDGLIQQILDHDYLIADKFIPFAERYLLGDLADCTSDDGVSIKKDLLFEMKALLNKELSNGEALISTYKPKYINAFVLMYMIYIKEEILNKLPDHLISDHTDMKIGYAISIEAMLLNNTIGTKDSFRDIIFASGLVPKDDDSKKLRITTQGEKILPAIQKSLKPEFSLKSYFLVCQLHEDYVQLSLHQVVTAPSSEEEEQESIIVQDEILDIPNIYDTLCTSMWQNLVQDSSLVELCEMHITSDDNEILDLFSSKTKTEFFANLKNHISDNVRVVLQNNLGTQNTADTHAVKLNSSCNCKILPALYMPLC